MDDVDDLDDVDDVEKMQTLFSVCVSCAVVGGRVCAGRGKSVEGSDRWQNVWKRTVHVCVAVWGW